MLLSENHMQKIATLKRMVINHSQFDSAYEKMHSAYLMNLLTGVPEHIICVGQSGAGKSTLKEKLKANIISEENGSKTLTPVLIVDTPAMPTVKNLAEEMLMKLGDFRFYSGSAIQKTTRVHHYLKHCEVKMIIFDELQHFIDRGSPKKSQEVADWMKTVIDQSKSSIVLMGLERCEYLFRINEQLRRRFSKRIDIHPFSIDNQESYTEFVGVIAAILDKMEMLESFDFRNKELIASIYFATNGIIGYLIKLFIGLYEAAIITKSTILDCNLFEMAFTENIWMEGTGKLNPFNKHFIWEKLDKSGMPFNRAEEHIVERNSI